MNKLLILFLLFPAIYWGQVAISRKTGKLVTISYHPPCQYKHENGNCLRDTVYPEKFVGSYILKCDTSVTVSNSYSGNYTVMSKMAYCDSGSVRLFKGSYVRYRDNEKGITKIEKINWGGITATTIIVDNLLPPKRRKRK